MQPTLQIVKYRPIKQAILLNFIGLSHTAIIFRNTQFHLPVTRRLSYYTKSSVLFRPTNEKLFIPLSIEMSISLCSPPPYIYFRIFMTLKQQVHQVDINSDYFFNFVSLYKGLQAQGPSIYDVHKADLAEAQGPPRPIGAHQDQYY